jgi:hypothetical protein
MRDGQEGPGHPRHPRPDAGRVPDTLIGMRDRALLALAGALRRAELMALEVAATGQLFRWNGR